MCASRNLVVQFNCFCKKCDQLDRNNLYNYTRTDSQHANYAIKLIEYEAVKPVNIRHGEALLGTMFGIQKC